MRTASRSVVALAGCLLAAVAAAAGALAGPMYRWDVLALGDAFLVLRWAAYGGAAAAVVALLGVVHARPGAGRKGLVVSVLGVALGATTFWLPYRQQQLAESVPPIHDITTDTGDPPRFEAVVPLRPEDANSLEYGGEPVARLQRDAYPDIRTASFDAPRTQVFEAALATARGMGWRVVANDEARGRIEAVDTTFWFGFKDDVVVTIETEDNRTRVDVRSVSRVGVSDVGKNARRIRAFMEALGEKL